MGDVYTSVYSQQGQFEETINAILSAGPLFLGSMVLMLTYIVIALGKWGPSSQPSHHNTKGYSRTYLAMGFANVRAGTQTRRGVFGYPPEH